MSHALTFLPHMSKNSDPLYFLYNLPEVPDDALPIEDDHDIDSYGFTVRSGRMGNRLGYDFVSRCYIVSEVPWQDFAHVVRFMFSLRKQAFLNLVFTVVASERLRRRISITRKRLLEISDDLESSLEEILTLMETKRYREIYESYDYEGVSRRYDHDIEDFRVIASHFTLVYGEEGGGYVAYRAKCRYLTIENCPDVYGQYDCFFDCIHHCLSLTRMLDVARLRTLMGTTREVTKEHVKRFEEITGTGVMVYLDEAEDGIISTYYKSVSDCPDPINLVLFNGHYHKLVGFTGALEGDVRPLKNPNSSRYLFYNFGTYTSPKTFSLTPYSMSYILCYEDRIIEGGVKLRLGSDDEFRDSVYEVFLRIMNGGHVSLVGFNNGVCDDYILIEILFSRGRDVRKVLVNDSSRIISMKCGGMVGKDMFMFVPTSLEEAVASFQCEMVKSPLSFAEIQEAFNEDRGPSLLNSHREQVMACCYGNVAAMRDLYFKCRRSFISINNSLDMDRFVTLPQMSMKAFDKGLRYDVGSTSYKHALPVLPSKFDVIVRKAMVGGRCQVFNKIDEDKHLMQSLDIVSMYPYVMIAREYPYEVYSKPTGSHKKWDKEEQRSPCHVTSFDPDTLGVYKVIVISQPKISVIPSRNHDGTLDWSPDHPFETWSDSVTLECLLRHGGSFETVEGYTFWYKTEKIFKSFLEPIVSMKEKQDELKESKSEDYNQCFRECLKFSMNSLSGKVGEKPQNKVRKLCNRDSSIDAFVNKYKKNISAVNVAGESLWLMESEISDEETSIKSSSLTSLLIYAYSREYMYDNFLSKVASPYMTDTDSLHFRTHEISMLDPKLFGNRCGQAKLELRDPCFAIYVAKKAYAMYKRDEEGKEEIVKFKFKGLGINDRVISNKDAERAKAMIKERNLKELLEIWKRCEDPRKLETLRRMIDREEVWILSIENRKGISGNGAKGYAGVYKSFYIKKILPSIITTV